MGKIFARKHHLALKRKRLQKEKIHKLVERYKTADSRTREQLAEKIHKLSAWYPLPGSGK